MTPVYKIVRRQTAGKYDEPYRIARSLANSTNDCLALTAILLPGMPDSLAEGFMFMGTRLNSILSDRVVESYSNNINSYK